MIKISRSEVTPFGGLHLIHKKVISKHLPRFINKHLGKRRHNAKYNYSDLILSLCYITLCGGDCAQDMEYVEDTIKHLKSMGIASPDTLLAMQKELSTAASEIISESGTVSKINVNDRMNDFLIKTALYLGVIKSEKTDYVLDFDHQFVPTEKYDATHSYKKERGYFPAVASIENIPVYIENRNGNCQVKLNQLDTLKRVFDILEKNGINPARCRMDCGSYLKELCNYLEEKGVKFCIRSEQSEELLSVASASEKWIKETIGIKTYEVCSVDRLFGKYMHRVVAYRWPNKTGQHSLITNDANDYLFIITNEKKETEKFVIEFYNDRGNSERLFDIQNNDFNWKKMPFSFLEQNTVYLIIMAVCNIVYQWLIGAFSQVCDFLEPCYRLKKFTFRFVCMAAKVIRTGRRQVVILFTSHDISALVANST
jgi:DDE family transposase